MRRGSLIGALALLVLSAGASARRLVPLPCPPSGGHLLASDHEVRVYRPSVRSPAVLACVADHRARMTLLAPPPPRLRPVHGFPGSLGKIVLSGPIVAYVVNRLTGVDTSSSELIVADVATRRILRSVSVGQSVDAGFLVSEALTSLVVTSRGSVAWIDELRRPYRHQETISVFAAPPTGSVILLDKGPSIVPESLTLTHGTLSWTDDGARQTATMP